MSKRDDIEWGGVDLTYSEALRRHLERTDREEQRSAPAVSPERLDEDEDPVVRAFRWLADNVEVNVEVVNTPEGR